MSKITLRFLADGIERVNRAFIENPDWDKDDYPPMVVKYLMSALLVALFQSSANDFGFYSSPDEVGYTGWLSIGNETLFFAPTKAVILEGAAGNEGELSPFGDVP